LRAFCRAGAHESCALRGRPNVVPARRAGRGRESAIAGHGTRQPSRNSSQAVSRSVCESGKIGYLYVRIPGTPWPANANSVAARASLPIPADAHCKPLVARPTAAFEAAEL
jgi:hypothetical protein